MRITIVLFCLLTGLLHEATGQDVHFSQYPRQATWLSPARCGDGLGDLRISGFHRNQWASVTVPYKTFSLSADARLSALNPAIKNLNMGLILLQDKAGDGILNTLQGALQASYIIPVLKDSVGFLRLGASFGFRQRSIDPGKLRYGAQLLGDAFQPLSSDVQAYDRTSFAHLDVGLGIGWTSFSQGRRFDWSIGLQHINSPDQHFLGDEAVRLPMLFSTSAELKIPLSEKSFVSPAAMLLLQSSYREVDLSGEYTLITNPELPRFTAIGMMLGFRNQDAIIPGLALYYKKYRFGLSYDINVSDLRKASHGAGGPEISIIYQAVKIREQVKHPRICPLY